MLQDNENSSDQHSKPDQEDEGTQPTSRVGLVGDGHHDLKLAVDMPAEEHKDEQEESDDNKSEAGSDSQTPAASNDHQTPQDNSGSEKQADKTVSEGDIAVTDEPVLKASGMLFYRDKPLFGLDIGYGSIKAMQVVQHKQKHYVSGYGETQFDPKIFNEGVISDPEAMAASIKKLMSHGINGHIDFERAIMSIPAARTYIRSVILPVAAADDLKNAVQLEVEQYTSQPLKDLYVDYSLLRKTEKDVQLLVAAVPKKIVNSYLAVADILDLEVISMEPTLMAVSRIFAKLDRADVPTVLIDLGSLSSDVIVYDNGVVTAGTVSGGGATLSALIANRLHLNTQDGSFMKEEYGIGPGYKQYDMLDAIRPQLEQIVQEVRRVMRYYNEHYQNRKIDQIVITGGGSNLRGLDDYLTNVLRVATRTFMPWSSIEFIGVKQLSMSERSVYITAGGLSLLTPKEIFS